MVLFLSPEGAYAAPDQASFHGAGQTILIDILINRFPALFGIDYKNLF